MATRAPSCRFFFLKLRVLHHHILKHTRVIICKIRGPDLHRFRTCPLKLKNISTDIYGTVAVSATRGDVVQVVSYFADASYQVLNPPEKHPVNDGANFAVVPDPQDLRASPKG